MSTSGKGPELDPYTERDSLITTLRRMCTNRLGTAALYMTADLTAILVWAGRTTPTESDDRETRLAIQIRSTRQNTTGQSITRAHIVLKHERDTQHRYLLTPTAGPFDELDQETAATDNYLRNIIQGATFDPRAAKTTLDGILLRRREQGIEES